MLCRWKNRETALLLVRMCHLRNARIVSSNVRSACSATRAKMRCACRSSGETLPPRGFGEQLPVCFHRCTHLTAELGLISKRSAASCREAPVSTVSTTRLRKSLEYDLGIAHSLGGESMHEHSLTLNLLGIPPIQIGRETL